MNLPSYNARQISEEEFQFYSKGAKGILEMRIYISPFDDSKTWYNMAFGVWNEGKQDIDDTAILRNGDMNTILATVAKVALEFLDRNPGVQLDATGYAEKGKLRIRTRRYQMGINENYKYLSEKYNIAGFIAIKDENGDIIGDWPNWDGEWYVFSNDTNYDAFSLHLK